MAELQLRGVNKNFGAVHVIKNVDLDIGNGEFVVFVGPSGCGKSTLLRTISGLEEITSGQVFIGGEDVTDYDPSERGVAMVFQSYALYPHMTVEQNMGFGLRMGGMPRDQVATRVNEAARVLEIEDLMARKPRQLSGGQRQRVAIGRAIVREPKAFLFDEPLSNLDAELRVQMRIEIAKLHQQLGATMVYVTHDQVEAMTLADRIVVLRAGIIEQQGTPIQLYDDPDNMFVAGFIGSPRMNFIGAEVVSAGGNEAEVRLAEFGSPVLRIKTRTDRAKRGDKVSVGVRPEHFVDGASAPAKLTGRAQVVEQLGGVSYVYAAGESGAQLTVQQRGHSSMATDTIVEFGVDPTTMLLFDADGRRI
jgi:lactose/L-arabinose transport system ATP-binding protein